MKTLITATGQYGPFTSIEVLADRYRCDGAEFLFSTIGPATIGDYVAKNYAIIEDGKVTNIAVAGNPLAPNWVQSDTAAIGDLYDGTNFTKPPPPAPVVPQQVTMRQACLALENAGILDDIESLVATLPRPYQIEWERASVVQRDNALVEVVRQQQGMTPAQIDDLFILAETL